MEYKKSNDLSVRKIDNEIFVFNRKTSQIHSFNTGGAYLWEMLDTVDSAEKLLGLLTDKYDVDISIAKKDVTEFLEGLVAIGLVVQS